VGPGSAFVFNELLRRRCISPTTQGVVLLFVSADRFVGKRHGARTLRDLSRYYVRCAGLLGHGDPFDTRAAGEIYPRFSTAVVSIESPDSSFFLKQRIPRFVILSFNCATQLCTLSTFCVVTLTFFFINGKFYQRLDRYSLWTFS